MLEAAAHRKIKNTIMFYIFYTNIVSPHQLPWCREFAKLVGPENFLYLAEEPLHEERASMGWSVQEGNLNIQILKDHPDHEQLCHLLLTCDVLFSTLRAFSIFRERCQLRRKTYYLCERWLKPPLGIGRVFIPSYFRMCRFFFSLCESEYFSLLPIGYPAIEDWCRLRKVLQGNLVALFRSENVANRLGLLGEERKEFPHMHLWGYFVDDSVGETNRQSHQILRILWCGRMLNWKRVDTLVRAVRNLLQEHAPINLQLVGTGPELIRLKRLVRKWIVYSTEKPGVIFHDSIPISEVRRKMRESDVYVLPSDGGEGWGAVVNEALAEGCIVVGTREAGASSTLIQNGVNGFLFSAGKVSQLTRLLWQIIQRRETIEEQRMREQAVCTMKNVWSPVQAASFLYQEVQK